MDNSIDLKTILDLHAKWLRNKPGGQCANLRGANLRGADLWGANLQGANLRGADLRGAFGLALVLAIASHIPASGPFHAWKKCRDGVVVKLLIPEDAERSHGSERKCRASKAVVLEVIGAEVGISLRDGETEYKVGQTVYPDGFDPDRWNTCGQGIHFYMTRKEAEAH